MDILIDFDGTVVTHEFPKIGKDIGAVPVLRSLVHYGHRLILFTMRSDLITGAAEPNTLGWNNSETFKLPTNVLEDAVNWFRDRDIPLYGINKNPGQERWTASPKAYGQLIIDDTALGTPLKYDPEYSERVFVDWEMVEVMLVRRGLIHFRKGMLI